jgi:tRNA (guanine-N7-)-methyltransferase
VTDATPHLRTIRSFVRREGRITRAQRRALDTLWPRFGIAANLALDFPTLFQRRVPVILEIGFGDGMALANMAEAHPENDYLGVEVHRPGIGSLLLQVEARALSNVRVVEGDAKLLLEHAIPDASLDAVHVFFPDPWPKARHHKRRLIQADFIGLVHRKLKPGGYLHLATDWEPYAEHMLAVLTEVSGFANTADGYAPRPDYRPLTKFERRGQRLGHQVRDLVYRRV